MNEQRCYRCSTVKPLDAFIARSDGRLYEMCRACLSDVLDRRPPKTRTRLTHGEHERTCYLCLRVLPNDRFTRRATGTYFSACKDCNLLVFAHRRRARLLGAGGEFTTEQWKALLASYDQCPMCRRPWAAIPPNPSGGAVATADHVVPLARGGSNDISNIQPLCYSCNSKKGTKLMCEMSE